MSEGRGQGEFLFDAASLCEFPFRTRSSRALLLILVPTSCGYHREYQVVNILTSNLNLVNW